jgi:hypothetical protein
LAGYRRKRGDRRPPRGSRSYPRTEFCNAPPIRSTAGMPRAFAPGRASARTSGGTRWVGFCGIADVVNQWERFACNCTRWVVVAGVSAPGPGPFRTGRAGALWPARPARRGGPRSRGGVGCEGSEASCSSRAAHPIARPQNVRAKAAITINRKAAPLGGAAARDRRGTGSSIGLMGEVGAFAQLAGIVGEARSMTREGRGKRRGVSEVSLFRRHRARVATRSGSVPNDRGPQLHSRTLAPTPDFPGVGAYPYSSPALA